MRDIFKKVMTGSMIAGAALLVAACGGNNEANNTAETDMNATDPMMEGTTNDVTAIDGANATDTNLGADANATGDLNAAGNTGATTADTNATNGM